MDILWLRFVSVFVLILTTLTLLTISVMLVLCNARRVSILSYASLVWPIIIFMLVHVWQVALLFQ